jgi:hypothetical protein
MATPFHHASSAMIAPSRPLWPEYLKALLVAIPFGVALSVVVILLQTKLQTHVDPHLLRNERQAFGEQLSVLLRVTVALLPVATIFFFMYETRLLRRLRRDGRLPPSSTLLLCGGGALYAGEKRIFGLFYLTRDEFGFVSSHPRERHYDVTHPLSSISHVCFGRVGILRWRALNVRLRDGREQALMPVATKTWATKIEEQRARLAPTAS